MMAFAMVMNLEELVQLTLVNRDFALMELMESPMVVAAWVHYESKKIFPLQFAQCVN